MLEILKNTAIALAEVNEDKHHKTLSFKAADCTIKFYTTTKKIIIQGSGSTSLTKAFSDFLNVKGNGDEAMNSNNGGQQSKASAADEHIEMYAIEQLQFTSYVLSIYVNLRLVNIVSSLWRISAQLWR